MLVQIVKYLIRRIFLREGNYLRIVSLIFLKNSHIHFSILYIIVSRKVVNSNENTENNESPETHARYLYSQRKKLHFLYEKNKNITSAFSNGKSRLSNAHCRYVIATGGAIHETREMHTTSKMSLVHHALVSVRENAMVCLRPQNMTL